ncbi:uncharacterized protein LOC122025249 isoform X2 [Zingiber officinale]|uniref:uncharacterized protein LOC122025249 isoform X2 n=1 Tax=Zingiber officinale TaxID=94328 RepID=UPI001C4C614F|nr:uncharacterized protein LOC122025249 isoform X2 [Zingiber officinale]
MEFEEKPDDRIHSRHSRSDSDSVNRRNKGDKLDPLPGSVRHAKLVTEQPTDNKEMASKSSPEADGQGSLKHEILQLEKRLKDQLTIRCALEKALGHSSSAMCSSNDSSMPKPTYDLIREIAILELEVMHLEQYLLMLYRKAFQQQTATPSRCCNEHKLQKLQHSKSELLPQASPKHKTWSNRWTPIEEGREIKRQERLLRPGAHRSHSSLSCRGVGSARISPSEQSLARALHSFHSQHASFLEDADSGMMSLAEYLGSPTADQIPDTPNKLSEDMVRCMATVYCKLADPPLISQTFFSSSSSSTTTSTIPGFSPQHLGEPWSPSKTEELKEFSTTVEIPHISENHKDVEDLLCNFKLILHQLDKVDPSKLKNDQKLAFWINVYNAIIMHAYIEHGIPEGGAKKTSLLIKAMCTIGGRSINAFMIQSFIFEGKTKSTTQWLRRMLLNPRSKYKDVDKRRNYAIEHSEPLLYFALSSGSHSDPPVRIYNSSRILKQLEVAKEEYIRSNVEIWKDQKILLPKLIDLYAKDSKLSSQKLVEMLQNNLPQNLKLALQRCQRFNKPIEWIPHNPQFRYLLSREFVFPQVN